MDDRFVLFAVILLLVGAGTTATIYAINSARVTIPGSINVKVTGVQAYQEEALENPVAFLNFADVALGESSTVIFWVKNNGTIPILLTGGAESWYPKGPLPTVISFTDSSLDIQEDTKVEVRVTIPADYTDTFAMMDVWIQGDPA